MEEATTLAENTAVLLNVSEFQSIDDATSALTSTLQAFGYVAQDSMNVVDVLNEVGNNYAISSDGIATALQDSASSLMAANNSYQQSVALIAAANRVVQDPNSVGAALRTISLRLRGTSTKELEEAGEDTEGVVESKSKLRTKIQGYTGIDILTDSGAYKSTYEILLEISKVWDDLTDQDRAGLLELIAGKTRSNTAAAILSNTKDLEAAYKSAMEAEGSALTENEKYLDSVQGRIDLLTNSIQTMWNNTLNSDVMKFFINIGTQLIKLADGFGLIKTLVMGIGTYLIQKHFKGDLIGGLFGESFGQAPLKYNGIISKRASVQSSATQAQADYMKVLRSDDSDPVTIEAYSNRAREARKELETMDAQCRRLGIRFDSTGKAGLNMWGKIKTGASVAGKAVLKFGQQMLQSMATMYVITTVIDLITTGIIKLIDVISNAGKSFENLQEKFEEARSEVDAITSDIENLESELDTTNERIEELMEQGTLTFVEQEELSRLKEVSEELKAQISLKKELQGSLQQGANDAAIVAASKYMDTSFANEKSRTEAQEEGAEKGSLWGKIAGVILAIGGLALSLYSGGSSLALTGAGLGMMGLGVFGAEPIGEAIGSASAGSKYDAEESVGEAIANMNEQRNQLIQARDEALAAWAGKSEDADLEEAYKTAEQELTQYNADMAQAMTQIAEYRNQITSDWEHALPEQKAQARAWGDILHAYNIEMGGKNAKSNAIADIFGEYASDDVQRLKEDIEDAMAVAKKNDTDPIFDFMTEIEGVDGLKQRLYNMGLTVTDVKYYFLDLAKAEKEAEDSYSTFDTVKEVNSLASGVKSLKDAFGEIQEEGYVSTETLVELEETFGGLGDSWENFVDTVATGTGSIKEATEAINELLEAYLTQQLGKGPMTAEEKLKTMMLLQQLGVKNAKEYMDAMEKASMVEKIASNIVSDKKKKKDLEDKINNEDTTEEEKEKAQKELDELNAKTREDYIKSVEDTYQTDLTPEEEQALLDKAIAVEEAKQEAEEAAKQQAERDAALLAKEEADEKAKNAQDLLDANSDEVNLNSLGITRKRKGHTRQTRRTVYYYNGESYGKQSEAVEAAKADLQQTVDAANAIEIPAEVDVEGLEDTVETVENDLKDAFNDVDLSIDVELTTPSDLVDQVQSVFDTLSDAVKEFNEKGYLSVDTVQGLLSDDIDSKYLTLLQDENGQLQLNKESLIELAKARMMDLGIQKATNLIQSIENALTDGHIDKARQLTEVNYGLTNSTWDLVDSESARVAVLMQEKGMTDEQIASFLNQISAIKQLTNSAVNEMGDAISSSSNGATESALEALQKKYERQIKNFDNQQTQIENEIERLEAEEQGVSADYYEKEIAIEEQKKALYEQQRTELLKLKRTDEVADALWEVEHAIQESTLRLIEFRKSIAELYATASDRISGSYDDLGQVYDDRKSYIENEISIRETKGELIPGSMYDELMDQEQLARDNAEKELNSLSTLYWQGIDNKELAPDSAEAIALLEKIRQKKLDIQGHDKAIAEYAEQQKDAYIAYFDAMMGAYSHRNDLIQSQLNSGQSYIDRLDILNINVPDEAYEKLSEIQELANQGMERQIAFAKGELDNFKAQGIDENDSRYIEKVKEITDIEDELYKGETEVLKYAQQIIDNHLDRFNQVIDRINHATSQLDNVSSLLDGEDVAEEDGSWTAAGLTQLGMAYQQMEYNKQVAAEYANEMQYLDEQLKAGQISEKEYTEQMQELKDGQWDAINAYKSAEDAIVDLNEARIDMIEEGLNKEIEAYQELIDLKKEELDAERDLYNFRKDIQKQTKDIAALERRLASMSGSTDAATVAERKKLEAELREARESLDDTYYNHNMDSQSKALDDELEAYSKSSEDYIKSLRESIKDTKLVVEQTFIEVLGNADIVLSKIDSLSEEYGFTIDDNLKKPWVNAAEQATTFKNTADSSVRNLINEGGIISTFGSEETQKKLSGVFSAGSEAASTFKDDVGKHMGEVKRTVESYTSGNMENYLGKKLTAPWDESANDENSGPLAFSNKVKGLLDGIVDYAETNYMEQLKKNLDYPWDAEEGANGYVSWGQGVTNMLQGKIKESEEAAIQISSNLGNIQTSSYVGGNNNSGQTGDGGNVVNPHIANLQKFLNYWFAANLNEDGIYGSKTKAALKVAQEKLSAGLGLDKTYPIYWSDMGKYNERTRAAFVQFVDDQIYKTKQNSNGSSMNGQYIQQMTNTKKLLPTTYFAKGTLGTTRDQFAITDESWIGEEITLAAGKNGQLQYLKKGSAVMPADISANLVEWGKLDPNMMGIGDMTGGIQLMSNYVNKPEIKLDIENFLKVDRVDRDTLPELEKLMDQKIDTFAKQLNYSIKRFK